MVITIYSKDSYRRIRSLKEIIKSYLDKYSAYYRFDFSEDEDLGGLKSVFSTNSMFSDKKLIVIDHPFTNRPKKEFKELLKKSTDDTSVVIVLNTDKKIPAGLPFLKKEPNIYKEQESLKGDLLTKFIIKEANKLGLKIGAREATSLKDSHGGNIWAIMREIEQASLRNTPEFIKKSSSTNLDYFSNINNLKKEGLAADRLTAMENLLIGRKDDPARVFNTIAFRPYNQKEAELFASYDIAIKSGKLDYEEVLLALALSLDLQLQ